MMSRKVFPQHDEIKRLRDAEGWGQDWVAQAADISKRTYQRIEAGEGCSIETLKSIASVFDVNFKALLPPPAPVADDQVDSFKPSWLRLSLASIQLLIIKPVWISVVVISVIAGGLGLSYAVHKSELAYVGMWEPPTAEEIAESKALMEKLNRDRVSDSKPILFQDPDREPPTEAEQYRSVLDFVFVIAALAWLFSFTWYFTKLGYNRDYERLIVAPFEKKTSSLWSRLTSRQSPA
jgi:DNA-binding XRE family transcriptional regulator